MTRQNDDTTLKLIGTIDWYRLNLIADGRMIVIACSAIAVKFLPMKDTFWMPLRLTDV